MKKIYIFLPAMLLAFFAQAQFPSGGKTPPSMGHVYGKIQDSAGRPVPGASVILLRKQYDTAAKKTREVLVKGMNTNSGGEFSFDELPIFGQLHLKISATGFKAGDRTVQFQMPNGQGGAPKPGADPAQAMSAIASAINGFDRDLGNIKLQNDVKQLESVTVTSTKPTLTMAIDKKVYNVEKDLVNAGGTALDIMKNVPSVSVDIDGNVKLRNASPQLYIDGRPTTLTLDQIPSDAIESVEVITNPSAKFDASGGGSGILNIVLKKNRKSGYNGNVRAGADSRGGYNAGFNFNLRQSKFNFTSAAFANANRGVSTGTTERFNFGDPATGISQRNYDKNKGAFIFGSLGLDYFLSNRTTISATGIIVHGEFKPYQRLDIDNLTYYPQGTGDIFSQRIANNHRQFDANGLQLAFKHLFPKEGETLTADLNFFAGRNHNSADYATTYFDHGPESTAAGSNEQDVRGTGNNRFLTVQTDYVHPFNAKTKLEAGLRMNSQHIVNNTDNIYNGVLLPAASINYENTSYVYAGYVSFTSAIKNFGYQVGLRAESSSYDGDLLNTKQHFSNNYPMSLFPSVFLSQKLANKQELQLSYTRRVNRPNFFQIIPYTDYTDSLNITRGNPDLVPEFTNSLELSYSKTLPKNNVLLFSVYYKQTSNLITRFIDTAENQISGKRDLINTYVNANSSYSVGGEITATTNFTRWWDMTTNINVYNSRINTDNVGVSQDALWSWFGKANANFKLPAKFKFQLTGLYQSKTNLPINTNNGQFQGPPGANGAQSSSQGYISAFWAVDAAVSRSFLKGDAASVSLSVGDIFRTRWSRQHSVSDGIFYQDYNRLRDPDLVRLNLTWRFGKIDVSIFKRKNLNGGGSQDAMQMQ